MAEIILDHISKRYPDGALAVDDVSLALSSNEIHGLIGPNGSGKTTMLNLLSGFYMADQGDITLNGTVLTHASTQQRTRHGLARTFQKPRLLETLSVLDNATLGGWNDARTNFLKTVFAWPSERRRDRWKKLIRLTPPAARATTIRASQPEDWPSVHAM